MLAKLETRQSLFAFRNITQEADGIIMSRGNLGLDVLAEKMALVQKALVQTCNVMGKPCIITRVVDTMVTAPRPTRQAASPLTLWCCCAFHDRHADGQWPQPAMGAARLCCGHSCKACTLVSGLQRLWVGPGVAFPLKEAPTVVLQYAGQASQHHLRGEKHRHSPGPTQQAAKGCSAVAHVMCSGC